QHQDRLRSIPSLLSVQSNRIRVWQYLSAPILLIAESVSLATAMSERYQAQHTQADLLTMVRTNHWSVTTCQSTCPNSARNTKPDYASPICLPGRLCPQASNRTSDPFQYRSDA